MHFNEKPSEPDLPQLQTYGAFGVWSSGNSPAGRVPAELPAIAGHAYTCKHMHVTGRNGGYAVRLGVCESNGEEWKPEPEQLHFGTPVALILFVGRRFHYSSLVLLVVLSSLLLLLLLLLLLYRFVAAARNPHHFTT